jgi:hypothetical protein
MAANVRKEDSMEDSLAQYRQRLVLAGQKAQEDYDKSVLSLSGGAFAVS